MRSVALLFPYFCKEFVPNRLSCGASFVIRRSHKEEKEACMVVSTTNYLLPL